MNHEQIYDRTARLRDLLAEAEKTGSFGEEIAEMYQTPDLSVVTITHGLAERVHSYKLIAEACELTPSE